MEALLIFAVLLLAPLAADAQLLRDIQPAHVAANVPPRSDFDSYMRRDLLAYFRSSGIADATKVEYQLLRQGPTQSGVAYPKYYLWVQVFSDRAPLVDGAVRVAAVERTHFEVMNFMSENAVRARPSEVGTVFPAVLVPVVLSKASAK